jgi:GT2 family glycosyltransferase
MDSNFLIVLVNYNNWEDTLECIDSLKKSGVKDLNILIVENCSSNDSLQKLKTAGQSIKIISTQKNLGFTGGNNLGIKYAIKNKYVYVILLNNDTIVDINNPIKLLIDEMEHNKDATLGTGRIFYYPDKNRIWYNGGKLIKWRGMAIHFNYRKNKNALTLTNELKNVDFISGCFMCIRLSDIASLGFLDDNFFMYSDDVEFCARALKKNLKLLFIPNAIIYHKAMGEKERSAKRIYYSIRNRRLLINLHFGIISKIYFSLVLALKRTIWFFTNNQNYKLLAYATKDYNNKYFGQAPEYIK